MSVPKRKTLNLFPRFIDETLVSKTKFGASMSIVMLISVAVLCISEFWNWFRPELKHQLVSAAALPGMMRDFVFDLDMEVRIPCPLLHVDAYLGEKFIYFQPNVTKERVAAQLSAPPSIHPRRPGHPFGRPGGRWRGDSKVQATPNTTCGDCYGAGDGCCNSCEDVVQAHAAKNWGMEDFRLWKQCQEVSLDGNEGCHLRIVMPLAGLDGHIVIAPGVHRADGYNDVFAYPDLDAVNLTHRIHRLRIGPSRRTPIDETVLYQNTRGLKHYRYSLNLVQKWERGASSRQVGFTVAVAEVPARGGRLGPGITFAFAWTPVGIRMDSEGTGFAMMVAHCISILGGAYMLARMIDSFGYKALSTLEGKMSIGKAD